MSAEALKTLRTHCKLTQAEFADAMGVPFRTYQDLEAGTSQVRPVHLKAAKFAVITLAFDDRSGVMLPIDLDRIIRIAVRNSEHRLQLSGLPYSRTETVEDFLRDFK